MPIPTETAADLILSDLLGDELGPAIPIIQCEYPSDSPQSICGASCAEPAAWTTDDLGDVHHLCDAHCLDAHRFNTFRTEPVPS